MTPNRLAAMAALAVAAGLLGGCVTGGGKSSFLSVGPRIDAPPGAAAQAAALPGIRLDVIVPVFDPGLPEDPDDYAEEGIWPELRRAEASRFALKLKEALQATRAFGDVRVTPDTNATGDLYVIGAIEESNGEDVGISVEVVDIAGNRWMSEDYDHRVKEYFWQNARNAGKDPYQPVFDEAAADVAELVRDRSADELTALRNVAEIRFARIFAPRAFDDYLGESDGRLALTALPDRNDPMLERTRAIRVRDGLFMDSMQTHYDAFRTRTEESYSEWQKHSLTEAKAQREARWEAIWRGALGTVLAIGGAVAAVKGGNEGQSGTETAGLATAIAGGVLIADSFSRSAEGRVHAEALSELGADLDLELTPQVIKLEETTTTLTGNTREQFRQWRAFLARIYNEEAIPEKKL